MIKLKQTQANGNTNKIGEDIIKIKRTIWQKILYYFKNNTVNRDKK